MESSNEVETYCAGRYINDVLDGRWSYAVRWQDDLRNRQFLEDKSLESGVIVNDEMCKLGLGFEFTGLKVIKIESMSKSCEEESNEDDVYVLVGSFNCKFVDGTSLMWFEIAWSASEDELRIWKDLNMGHA